MQTWRDFSKKHYKRKRQKILEVLQAIEQFWFILSIGALFALKRKKMLEKEVAKLDG